MTETLQPLRLAVGSHKAGTGKGCGMNVISWENGDTTITDYPGCADPFLARVVQIVNDHQCTHREKDLLCAPCSVEVLDLAHRTVGTGDGDRARMRVWARLAVDLARDRLPKWHRKATLLGYEILPIAQDWLDGPGGTQALLAAGFRDWGDREHWLPVRAVRAAAYAAIGQRGNCQLAATATWVVSRPDGVDRIAHAHRLFDDFERLTGATGRTPDPDAIDAAIALMLTQEGAVTR
jgi:hypothetical protein